MSARSTQTVEIEGRKLTLSNLDKVLYPKAGFTKGQVIDYYLRISPWLLPHLEARPLTLKRYPDGVESFHFYEKRCPSHRPPWVKTTSVWSGSSREHVDYCLAEDVATLVWLANLADLELHTSLSRAENVLVPTMVAFDLDPGPPADVVSCARIAIELRALFSSLGLEAFPKTSGSKGMQVYLPVNRKATSYDETKSFAHAVALALEREHPKLVVSRMRKSLRPGKVFIDWSQNDDHKTTVCVYSLRAKEVPTVSTPLLWEEVEACARSKDPRVLFFRSDDVLRRVEEHGDLFEPVLTRKQKLPKAV